jgi:hypothetical protein
MRATGRAHSWILSRYYADMITPIAFLILLAATFAAVRFAIEQEEL